MRAVLGFTFFPGWVFMVYVLTQVTGMGFLISQITCDTCNTGAVGNKHSFVF
jgi:hypothetical protein